MVDECFSNKGWSHVDGDHDSGQTRLSLTIIHKAQNTSRQQGGADTSGTSQSIVHTAQEFQSVLVAAGSRLRPEATAAEAERWQEIAGLAVTNLL